MRMMQCVFVLTELIHDYYTVCV